ncbi:hypothetical protein B9Z55_012216 [Caenorhabditis nigoni]|uniref:Receptor L-domain domain-containing protein n=1 Tax=Caenorhabditis nigoni TaxID=1611254 RepID=A0A2G5TWB5_9PELO|nr:hypothetical protein B9Z55_012216 [Caenorhabditis nigoni]
MHITILFLLSFTYKQLTTDDEEPIPIDTAALSNINLAINAKNKGGATKLKWPRKDPKSIHFPVINNNLFINQMQKIEIVQSGRLSNLRSTDERHIRLSQSSLSEESKEFSVIWKLDDVFWSPDDVHDGSSDDVGDCQNAESTSRRDDGADDVGADSRGIGTAWNHWGTRWGG